MCDPWHFWGNEPEKSCWPHQVKQLWSKDLFPKVPGPTSRSCQSGIVLRKCSWGPLALIHQQGHRSGHFTQEKFLLTSVKTVNSHSEQTAQHNTCRINRYATQSDEIYNSRFQIQILKARMSRGRPESQWRKSIAETHRKISNSVWSGCDVAKYQNVAVAIRFYRCRKLCERICDIANWKKSLSRIKIAVAKAIWIHLKGLR